MKINIFNTTNLFEAATNLFQSLGIKYSRVNACKGFAQTALQRQRYV
jgi:hypothetical protein